VHRDGRPTCQEKCDTSDITSFITITLSITITITTIIIHHHHHGRPSQSLSVSPREKSRHKQEAPAKQRKHVKKGVHVRGNEGSSSPQSQKAPNSSGTRTVMQSKTATAALK
jgi:hypothetical protein